MDDFDFAEVPQVTARMSVEQRRFLLASILSDPFLFSTARMRLKPDLFNGMDEVSFRAIWTTALQLADQYGPAFFFDDRKRTWNVLDSETKSSYYSRPDLYPIQYWDDAFGENGFIPWLFGSCVADEFSPVYGERLLMDFLRERAINDTWQRLSRATANGVVTNLSSMVRDLATKESEILSFGYDPVESGAPAGWMPPPTAKRSTGIPWLDALLGGGHQAPETYGVCGAIGSGKTTLALQIALAVARREAFFASGSEGAIEAMKMENIDTSKPYEMGYAYYFHYEMSTTDIRKKLWSSAAMIDYKRIELLGTAGFSLDALTQLSPGENSLCNTMAAQMKGPTSLAEQMKVSEKDFAGELARLEAACRSIDLNFRQIDCTGDKHPGLGTGYIPEIAAILAGEKRKGHRPAVVIVDYAMSCVERHTEDEKRIYQLLSTFGRQFEDEVTKPFHTPGWIFHQLSGEANLRTAATKQHHGNAMGSKRFAQSCWFCFNLGTADEKTGCRYFTPSKARRESLGTPPIIKIANGFNRMIDVSSQFKFDRGGKATPLHAAAASPDNGTVDTTIVAEPPVVDNHQAGPASAGALAAAATVDHLADPPQTGKKTPREELRFDAQ